MRYDIGWISLLIAATILSIGSTSETIDPRKNGQEETDVNYRLPTTIKPTSYEIILELPSNFSRSFFKGTVKINATVDEETDKIVFNQGHITITFAGVHENGKSISVLSRSEDKKTEKCTLTLEKKLSKGSVITIALTYVGYLRDDMIGAYKSSYVNANGERKWLIATQFHAVHARHAFPCFDEPSFKATFIVRILRPTNYRCLSNMRLKKSTETSIGVWDEFGNSVRMSTYLVAFVVSDFTNLENYDGNFRVWARPNAIEQADYALKIGQQALSVLSGHFDEPFQLPKMDMVAVPDFSAGAMENWGLITYREARMLYDAKDSSITAEQDVASVIVHECVHSWFGNLVTPNWWDYLWLSEGFARYYQYITTAKVKPTWKMEQQFVVDQIMTVFGVDALESSNPMNREVYSPAEIGTTGDTITYAKGASVIRMMELTFGSEIFNAGLKEYLQENKYSSASPKNLWSALQNQVNKYGLLLKSNVETIMDTWTSQAGFPVLTVNIVNSGKFSLVTFEQKRFLLRNITSPAPKTIWWIPVSWATEKNADFTSTSPKYWLNSEKGSIQVDVDVDEWIVFNIQKAGYYRVNYDKDSWYRIINVLTSDNYEDIHEINRAAIVDDLMNLARVDLIDYDTALTGLNYIKREKNYLPFKAAFAGLDYLNKRFEGHESYHWISNFSVSIVDYIYEELGYDDKPSDDDFNILLRKEINLWACSFDHPNCVDKSLNYFNQWRDKNVPIPKNQRQAVYCTAIRYGSEEDWNFLWAHYLNSNSAAEQLVVLKGLGCSQNTKILEKYLMLAITNFEQSGIRKQDSASVFSSVYGSGQFGAEYILNFVAKHHASISLYYGGFDTLATILSGASQRFSTQDLITKFETLIQVHTKDFNTINKSLQESLDLAKYELQWFELHEEEIITWMQKNGREEPSTTVAPLEPSDTTNTTDYRLPTNIVPESYNIQLTPYIEPGKFTFDGIVNITANVAEDTDKIVLHINEIEIEGIAVSVNNKHIPLKNFDDTPNKYNFLTISLNETLEIGTTVTIQITYTGQLNTAMKGFYRSSYVNKDNETRWLATTHLEPVGARKMFPCFDEPALKAVFIISVNRPADYKAISNTPLESSGPVTNGRVWDTFEPTPPMSTYLVALIVSDFESLVDKTNNCAVWARPNGIQQAKYALKVMAPLVAFYEKALGHPYQIKKLDMAAIPDFASGAMENWGLLTYRETNMLYDEKNSPITAKQAIGDVISHEISHQWFGDEVTPRWWKYLWLSEGFARYFQYHGTANVETEWGLKSQFVVEQLFSAFVADSLPTTHPMTHDVYSPSEIRGIFDTISYAKSASVLRMVEKILGEDLFYAALHDYIAERSYNDSTPEYLYAAFQSQIDSRGVKLGESFKTIMDSWTTQSGYPIVDVSIVNGVASFSQKRYLSTNPDNLPVNNVWWIPINWASKSKPDFTTTAPKYWLSKEKDSVQLNVSDEWVILNVQQAGYYRVNYDTASWNRIIDVLKSDDYETIHEVNRASLIDSLFDLGKSGKVDYHTVFSATQYLSKEKNYIPWRAAFYGFAHMNLQLNGTYVYNLYRTHMLKILLPIYEKLGLEEVESEPHYDKLLRIYVVNLVCAFEVEDACIKPSLNYFSKWTADPSKPVPVNIRDTVYCTAIKYGPAHNWEFLWKQYVSPGEVTKEKQVILNALGCSTNERHLEKLLMSAITKDSEIRLQDSTTVFSAVHNSGLIGAEYTLEFVKRNYEKMRNYYEDDSKIGTILSGVSSRLRNANSVSKFKEFVDGYQMYLPEIQSSLQTSLARAQKELTWFEKYGPRIYEWLDKTYGSESYRLPKNIKPIDYDIYFTPYLDEGNFTFDGEIRINMEVLSTTSKLVLLANQLTIKNIIVYVDSVNRLEVTSHTLNDDTTHKFTIYLNKMVPSGSQLSAYITYTGILNDKNRGFYRSSYVDSEGKTRWLASTQFEPVYARQAFPCFDEPSFKAKFRINIERPNEYKTLSNMPSTVSIKSDKLNWTYDSFEESKLMSSYLVAFVVSDFQALENTEKNFRLWARPQIYEHGAYALDVGQNVLKFLEHFTGINYPISKMDLVAVPDFDMGAMENWGLVTFREYGLIYNENVTSAKYKRYLNTVVAHELVHMWFGNLVTCDWWNHIWLHEGFAQYIQWIASDYTEPDWNLLQQVVVYEVQEAMIIDASPTIRPMNNEVSKPLLIINTFDKIAYAKSASVIRMMHHAFGPAVFEPGLHSYLDANKYSNAIPDDLWSAFQIHEDQEKSLGNLNVSIKTLMDSWTNQAGYPVVTATWNNGLLTLEQKRFLFSESKKSSDETENLYWIPITMTTKNESNFEETQAAFWFNTKRFNMPLPLKTDEWFIINIQETGYYRVNYDNKSWNRLSAALKSENHDGIHAINRAQIVDDLLNLARTDYVDYEFALETMKYLVTEKNHLPWKSFFEAIAFLNQRFNGHEIGQIFADFVLGLSQNMYNSVISYDDKKDDQLSEFNRILIMSWACKFGHSGCIESAKMAFDEWKKDESKTIPPNERPAVYCTSIKEGNHEDWEFLWNEYEKTNYASEKVVILGALGCSRNISTINSYLKRAISGDNAIRYQDIAAAFSSVYGADKFGADAALDFLVENYKDVKEYYGNWSDVASLFSNVAGKLSTQEQIEKLELFVNETSTELVDISSSLEKSVEKAKENLDWFKAHSEKIHAWLTKPPTELPKPDGDNSGDGNNTSSIATYSLCLVLAAFFFAFRY